MHYPAHVGRSAPVAAFRGGAPPRQLLARCRGTGADPFRDDQEHRGARGKLECPAVRPHDAAGGGDRGGAAAGAGGARSARPGRSGARRCARRRSPAPHHLRPGGDRQHHPGGTGRLSCRHPGVRVHVETLPPDIAADQLRAPPLPVAVVPCHHRRRPAARRAAARRTFGVGTLCHRPPPRPSGGAERRQIGDIARFRLGSGGVRSGFSGRAAGRTTRGAAPPRLSALSPAQPGGVHRAGAGGRCADVVARERRRALRRRWSLCRPALPRRRALCDCGGHLVDHGGEPGGVGFLDAIRRPA